MTKSIKLNKDGKSLNLCITMVLHSQYKQQSDRSIQTAKPTTVELFLASSSLIQHHLDQAKTLFLRPRNT